MEDPYDGEAVIDRPDANALAPISLDQPGPHAEMPPVEEAIGLPNEPSSSDALPVIITRAAIRSTLYAILQAVDVNEVTERQIRKRVSDAMQGSDMNPHKEFIRKHCMHVVTHMQLPGATMEDLKPLDYDEEGDDGQGEGEGEGKGKGKQGGPGGGGAKRVRLQGKKRKGEEEDEDWDEDALKGKRKKGKSSRSKKDAFVANDDDEEEELGDEEGELKGHKGKPTKARKTPQQREKKSRKVKSQAESAVDAMDQPGGLGEYDPRRAEAELSRRQDARHDIKAAHKACLKASTGELTLLIDLLEAASHQGETRALIIDAANESGKEALGFMASSLALLKALDTLLDQAMDEGGPRGRGASDGFSQPLLGSIISLLSKLPSGTRAQSEAIKGSGLITTLKRAATESGLSIKVLREQVTTILHRWEGKGSASLGSPSAPSSSSRPPIQPQKQQHSFLPSFLQPFHQAPLSSAKESLATEGTLQGQGKRGAAVAAPAAGTALSEQERKKKAAEEQARARRKVDQVAGRASIALPKIASFEDYQKKNNPSLKPSSNQSNPTPSAPQPGKGQHLGPSEPSGSKESEEELQWVVKFVKKHLVSLVESGGIKKQDYPGIKEKVVKKVLEGNKAKGSRIDEDFFSSKNERGKDQAAKVVKLIEGYVTATAAGLGGPKGKY